VDAVLNAYLPAEARDPRIVESPFASDAGVETLLRAAGFEGIETHSTQLAVRFDDQDQWYGWSWSVGQRGMWERVPADELPAVRRQTYEQLQHCRDADGRIGFDQGVRYTLGRRPA